MKRVATTLLWLGLGTALTGIFWAKFWQGQGLIGGDIYTYFLPQKVYYAECLAAGEFPLWNHWVGHGYPLIAESQTGAFYPPNFVAYQLFEINTAYNILQVLHYILGFAFSVALARALGFRVLPSALVGVVFIYGWFPARLSWEWAILTGAWMPAAIWVVEKLMSTGRWRYGAGLAIVLSLQMLAGHFNLAFMTQVLVVAYALGRIWCHPTPENLETSPTTVSSTRKQAGRVGLVLASLALGFGLAAVQLIPTWELKALSQRSSVGTYYDPAYGHLPPWYWTQVVAPFVWYGPGTDLNAALPPDSPPTNAVEAHLYFGLVPVLLLLFGLFTGVYWRDRRWWFWGFIGLLALIYATGWLLPLTKPLPGFHFFRGVGRWGIITTFAVALLSGAALNAWMNNRRSRTVAFVMASIALVLTVIDLRIVSGLVGDAIFVESPPIQARDESPVRRILKESPEPVRLFSRGANLPTLLGVSSTPVYLGFGPDAYFDPQTTMPEPLPFDESPTPEQIEWLQRAGVTHVLSFSPLEESVWPVEPVWSGYDLLLSRSWGRGPNEPLSLYRLNGSRGRAAWVAPDAHAMSPKIQTLSANRVTIETESDQERTLVLTGLMYPGWQVSVDGELQEPITLEGMYRGVVVPAGEHRIEWRYNPTSQYRGYWCSGIAGVLLVT
ncbi:MAG: YfhO family protein, partial [Planctomycetaceae bacterium]|nr:YfhO family protein [Planctomycetaceae bacterium]